MMSKHLYPLFYKVLCQIRKAFDEGLVNKLRESSHLILNKCFKKSVGLLVGKIQSGKTMNYISLIALAFDKKYQIVIVLSGIDREINKQTEKRIKSYFQDKILFKDYKVKVISSKDIRLLSSFTDQIGRMNQKIIDEKEKIIFTVLKNYQNLDWLLTIFKKNNDLKRKKVLIIDDEGDLASLDGNKNTKNPRQTKIHSQIKNLRNKLEQYSYLSVTATPYANLLLNLTDSLSPDFMRLLEPSENYFGLESLFDDQILVNPYLQRIENFEANIIQEKWEKPPQILQKAISTFIFVSLKFKKNKNLQLRKDNIARMLIHTDVKQISQKDLYYQISNWLSILKKWCKNYSKEPNSTFSLELLDFFNLGLELFEKRKINLLMQEDKKLLDELICYLCSETNIRVINSAQEFKKHREESIYPAQSLIIIGAKLLERGMTYDNLLVTFITRRAQKRVLADNTLQRARWLGYRQDYAHLVKIFLTEQVENDFVNIKNMEFKLWEQLKDIEMNDIPSSEWDIHLISSTDDMIPTNPRRVKWDTPMVGINNLQISVEPSFSDELKLIDFWRKKSYEKKYGQMTFKELESTNWEEFEMIFLHKKNFELILKQKLNCKNPFIDNHIFKSIREGTWLKVVLMFRDKERSLSCKHLFSKEKKCQGVAFHIGPRKNIDYLGDYKFNNYESNKNKIILQVHKATVNCQKNGKLKDKYFYFLQLPKNIFPNKTYTRLNEYE